MRSLTAVPLALAACLTAAPSCLAATPLVLGDPDLPLWEIRPLDRHVYVLSLEGEWKEPPDRYGEYYVNIEYPDGAVVQHRPTLEPAFRGRKVLIGGEVHQGGEVQVLLIQYQYEKHHFEKGDVLKIWVTKRTPGGGPDDQEVVSNGLEVAWPFDREVVRLPPKTRFSEPEPIDAFHPPGEEPVPPPQTKPNPPPLEKPPVEEPVKPPKPGPEK